MPFGVSVISLLAPSAMTIEPEFVPEFVLSENPKFSKSVIKSDEILFNLRKENDGYKIPQNFLYKYISCPNYFGEIIEWAGFAIMVWSLPALSFLLWTMFNLIPRAVAHHKWYHSKFSDYPKERKAVIPFIL